MAALVLIGRARSGVPLVNVPHRELADELVEAIAEHRARLDARSAGRKEEEGRDLEIAD